MNHTSRTADLKRMLTDRRREVRAEAAGTQGGIDLALVQVSLQTVARIDDALAQLDAGKYGSCLECAREISELRLRALPFAVRCQSCEERASRNAVASRP
jgi:RNA polymerase-binding transcription factor DksA